MLQIIFNFFKIRPFYSEQLFSYYHLVIFSKECACVCNQLLDFSFQAFWFGLIWVAISTLNKRKIGVKPSFFDRVPLVFLSYLNAGFY